MRIVKALILILPVLELIHSDLFFVSVDSEVVAVFFILESHPIVIRLSKGSLPVMNLIIRVGIRQLTLTVILRVTRFALVSVLFNFLLSNCSGDDSGVERLAE